MNEKQASPLMSHLCSLLFDIRLKLLIDEPRRLQRRGDFCDKKYNKQEKNLGLEIRYFIDDCP